MSSFLSKVFTSDAARFVGRHVLIGLRKAASVPIKNAGCKRNTQCVKLTKNHKDAIQLVSFWCNLRINQLQQAGALKETIDRVILYDARFLTVLTHAIDVQNDPKPPFDAWLFFNEDVKSTDFFELQHCICDTKVAKVSYVINNEF